MMFCFFSHASHLLVFLLLLISLPMASSSNVLNFHSLEIAWKCWKRRRRRDWNLKEGNKSEIREKISSGKDKRRDSSLEILTLIPLPLMMMLIRFLPLIFSTVVSTVSEKVSWNWFSYITDTLLSFIFFIHSLFFLGITLILDTMRVTVMLYLIILELRHPLLPLNLPVMSCLTDCIMHFPAADNKVFFFFLIRWQVFGMETNFLFVFQGTLLMWVVNIRGIYIFSSSSSST